MKKSIFIAALSTLCIGITLTSCKSAPEKVDDAKQNVVEAELNLDKAKADYEEEYAKFKMESDQRIAENDKELADLRAHSAQMKKEAKDSTNIKTSTTASETPAVEFSSTKPISKDTTGTDIKIAADERRSIPAIDKDLPDEY